MSARLVTPNPAPARPVRALVRVYAPPPVEGPTAPPGPARVPLALPLGKRARARARARYAPLFTVELWGRVIPLLGAQDLTLHAGTLGGLWDVLRALPVEVVVLKSGLTWIHRQVLRANLYVEDDHGRLSVAGHLYLRSHHPGPEGRC